LNLNFVKQVDFIKWPESICKSGWTVFGLIGFGREMPENIVKCPKTYEIVKNLTTKYGFEVTTAGFSSMQPGTWIQPHVGYEGYSDYIVRMHMGLVIPKEREKCSIRVGNEHRSWELGKTFVFDDFLTHEAWNCSSETRIILLLDLKYEKKAYLQAKIAQQEDIDVNTPNFSNGVKGLLKGIDQGKLDASAAFK